MEVKGKGRLVVQVYTSRAKLPVVDATVVVTQRGEGGKYKLLSVQAPTPWMTQPTAPYAPARGKYTPRRAASPLRHL